MIDPATALRLDGKVALITGATRGIGRAIAEACGAAGASVCVVARKPEELDETAQALSAIGAKVITVQGSVGDPEIPERAVADTIAALGSCDIVINNAAINPVFAPLMDADLGAVTKVFDANITAPLDIVFCDIDKHDYPNALPVARRLLRPGGLFITDNMLWDGKVLSPPAGDKTTAGVAELTRLLREADDFATTIVPIRDGVSVAVRIR